jgi:hypothetical protein
MSDEEDKTTTEHPELEALGVRSECFATLGAGKAGGIEMHIVFFMNSRPAVRLVLLRDGKPTGSVVATRGTVSLLVRDLCRAGVAIGVVGLPEMPAVKPRRASLPSPQVESRRPTRPHRDDEPQPFRAGVPSGRKRVSP